MFDLIEMMSGTHGCTSGSVLFVIYTITGCILTDSAAPHYPIRSHRLRVLTKALTTR